MSTKTQTRSVCFTVDFEGMTDRVREFWMERKYAYAVNLLVRGFHQSETNALRILAGELRMIDAPEGKPGVDGSLAPDAWKAPGGTFYPNPRFGLVYAEAALGRYLAEDENAKLRDQLHDLVDSIVDEENTSVARRLPIDDFLDKQDALEKRLNVPVLKPDRTFKSDMGWILPNGHFYAAEHPMEHIAIAAKLGKQTERDAELAGWVKLCRDMYRTLHIFAEDKPTQKQLDTLFDWVQKDTERRDEVYREFMERYKA